MDGSVHTRLTISLGDTVHLTLLYQNQRVHDSVVFRIVVVSRNFFIMKMQLQVCRCSPESLQLPQEFAATSCRRNKSLGVRGRNGDYPGYCGASAGISVNCGV